MNEHNATNHSVYTSSLTTIQILVEGLGIRPFGLNIDPKINIRVHHTYRTSIEQQVTLAPNIRAIRYEIFVS